MTVALVGTSLSQQTQSRAEGHRLIHPDLQVGVSAPHLARNHFNGLQSAEPTMDIKESDWRTFRKLRELALDRFCQRALEDVQRVLANLDDSNHKRYLKLWELLQDRDEAIAIAFNDPRRSTAFIQLANIVAEDLLTKAELNQFSEDLRKRIEAIKPLRNS